MKVSELCRMNNAGSLTGPFFLNLVAIAMHSPHWMSKLKEANQFSISISNLIIYLESQTPIAPQNFLILEWPNCLLEYRIVVF